MKSRQLLDKNGENFWHDENEIYDLICELLIVSKGYFGLITLELCWGCACMFYYTFQTLATFFVYSPK